MGTEKRAALGRGDFADLLGETETGSPALAMESIDTQSLCETLLANLDAQNEVYLAYLEQANRQRQALVNRRLTDSLDVNEETDRLLNSLAGLERERIAVTAKILGPRLAGAASTPAKCEAIFPMVSPVQAARLKGSRDILIASVAELKRVLAVNMALVDNGSRIIHTTIGIMTSVAGRSKTDKMNTYTSKGNVNMGKTQLRNLVNRSV
jgi:flagellar FlgN protein